MTQEKKELLEKMANIIDQLLKQNRYTNVSVEAKPGDVFFDEACRFIMLVFGLDHLRGCLRNMIKFSEMGDHKPEEK